MSKLDDAFKAMPRRKFLPPSSASFASFDMPLAIGFGQTNSQPFTVRSMLEWLDPQVGDKILDVGSGSGWSTALLAHLVGNRGKVYAVERVPELVEFGGANLARADIKNARVFEAGKIYGLPEFAPYDRILVSAAADKFPPELLDQLKTGGKMVIPVAEDILEITKQKSGKHTIVTHPGFIFVPLL
jgi:protein-L-isoaspartate(D-aspartate) O-methyltransferase